MASSSVKGLAYQKQKERHNGRWLSHLHPLLSCFYLFTLRLWLALKRLWLWVLVEQSSKMKGIVCTLLRAQSHNQTSSTQFSLFHFLRASANFQKVSAPRFSKQQHVRSLLLFRSTLKTSECSTVEHCGHIQLIKCHQMWPCRGCK